MEQNETTEITTEELDNQVAQALENQEDVVKEEVVEATATPEETDQVESKGLANLRSHAEALEADINNVYKPALSIVEQYGGVETVKDGMSLYDALQEFEADKAAESFLDKVFELSPERYNAVVASIFRTHGDDFLKLQQPQEENRKSALDIDDYDDQDPVKQAILQAQQEVAELKAELAKVTGAKEQETQEQQQNNRLNEYFQQRYAPLENSLKTLDFGDQTKEYRDDIRRIVEGAIEEDEHLMKIFNEAAVLVRDGNGKLAASRIAEFDRKSSEYINAAIKRVSNRYAVESAVVREKIQNPSLPKASEAAAAAAPRTTPSLASPSKAFDESDMIARLRALEASGRFSQR